MHYKETKLKSGKYRVASPNSVHAKGTTKAKADSQMRLLRGVEHGWTPDGATSRGKSKRKGI